jgi:transcriptional regulator with XRE-family HTH domain
MKADEFNNYLKMLGLSQSAVAAHLQVAPRTVRRWQNGEQQVPKPIADLLKAWHQLDKAKIPWSADLESFWHGDADQIRRHQDHALVLADLLQRVERRGGVSAPWRVSLKDHEATLEAMTVHFYALANGGFSLASYRRSDKAPDIHRDWPLIEDAVAVFAAAVGKAREKSSNQRWDE